MTRLTFANLVRMKYVDARGLSTTKALHEIRRDTGVSIGSLRAALNGTKVTFRTAEQLALWAKSRHKIELDPWQLFKAPRRSHKAKSREAPRREFSSRELVLLGGEAIDGPLTTAEVARLFDCSTQRARRWLKRAGAFKRAGLHGKTGHYLASLDDLTRLPLAPRLRPSEQLVSAQDERTLSVSDVAKLLGWSPRKTRAWLVRERVAVRLSPRGRYIVTVSRLLNAFREDAFRLLDEKRARERAVDD